MSDEIREAWFEIALSALLRIHCDLYRSQNDEAAVDILRAIVCTTSALEKVVENNE
jgi:hypothetical protein